VSGYEPQQFERVSHIYYDVNSSDFDVGNLSLSGKGCANGGFGGIQTTPLPEQASSTEDIPEDAFDREFGGVDVDEGFVDHSVEWEFEVEKGMLEQERLEEVELKRLEEVEVKKKRDEEVEKKRLEVEELKRLEDVESERLVEVEKKRLQEMEKKMLQEMEKKRLEDEEKKRLEAVEKKRLEDVEKKMLEEVEKKRLEDEELKKLEEVEKERLEELEKKKLDDVEKARSGEVEKKRIEDEKNAEERKKKKLEESEKEKKIADDNKKKNAEQRRKKKLEESVKEKKIADDKKKKNDDEKKKKKLDMAERKKVLEHMKMHDNVCQLCYAQANDEKGVLGFCKSCPRSYHISCLPHGVSPLAFTCADAPGDNHTGCSSRVDPLNYGIDGKPVVIADPVHVSKKRLDPCLDPDGGKDVILSKRTRR
jgi:hypothetical protein